MCICRPDLDRRSTRAEPSCAMRYDRRTSRSRRNESGPGPRRGCPRSQAWTRCRGRWRPNVPPCAEGRQPATRIRRDYAEFARTRGRGPVVILMSRSVIGQVRPPRRYMRRVGGYARPPEPCSLARSGNASSNTEGLDRTGANCDGHVSPDHPKSRTTSDGLDTGRVCLLIRGSGGVHCGL